LNNYVIDRNFPAEEPSMKWVVLFSSIVCEVIGTTCLKLSADTPAHRMKYGVGVVVFYLLCFMLLGGAMKHFSLSVVYATWSGVGVGMLAIIGVLFFGDTLNAFKLVSFALVILGVVGLNMSGVSH